MARRPPNSTIRLDPNPTPEDEAKDFENLDERRERQAHELAVIAARKGIVGKLTGSTNEVMNVALIVMIVLVAALGISNWVNPTKADLAASDDNFWKAILAVIGFVFGSKASGK